MAAAVKKKRTCSGSQIIHIPYVVVNWK